MGRASCSPPFKSLFYFDPSLPQFSNVTNVPKDLDYCLKVGMHTSVRRGEPVGT